MTSAQFIVWKDEYRVGHRTLDNHHATMFKLINNLYSAMSDNASVSDLDVLFGEAVAYAKMHFAKEESILCALEYPYLEAQQKAHKKYLREIESLLQRAVAARAISEDMLHFLKDWWLNHILKMDKAYAPVLSGLPD